MTHVTCPLSSSDFFFLIFTLAPVLTLCYPPCSPAAFPQKQDNNARREFLFGRGQCQSCTAFLIIIPWYRAKRKDIDIIIYFSIVAKGWVWVCVCSRQKRPVVCTAEAAKWAKYEQCKELTDAYSSSLFQMHVIHKYHRNKKPHCTVTACVLWLRYLHFCWMFVI